jgi:hypothetical protein
MVKGLGIFYRVDSVVLLKHIATVRKTKTKLFRELYVF